MAQTQVNGEAGNGLVKVTATCNHVIHKIDIDPKLIAQSVDDKEMLEDLVLAAIADAYEKAEDLTSSRMSQFTAGLPAGMGDFSNNSFSSCLKIRNFLSSRTQQLKN